MSKIIEFKFITEKDGFLKKYYFIRYNIRLKYGISFSNKKTLTSLK